ncbi:MAG: hypothetical protein ACFFAO_19790, partial [Candidatus Hermodarchaeota archaeon]
VIIDFYKLAPDLDYALYRGFMGKLGKLGKALKLNKILALIYYYKDIKPYPIKYLSSDGIFLYEELISLVRKKKGLLIILGAIRVKYYLKYVKKWKINIIITNDAEYTRMLLKYYQIRKMFY